MAEIGYYQVKLLVENEHHLVGSPTLNLTVGVNAASGQVEGTAEITQALAPPHNKIVIPHLTGTVHHTGFGADTLLVSLQGEYPVSFPPPAIGMYLAHFTAAFAVDKAWNGRGTYTYDRRTVPNCTVKNVG